MGCDIHTTVERKLRDKWNFVNIKPEIFYNRNYGMFGFLANVRNYSGIEPISNPRGFPENASDESKSLLESWGSDAHSASYLMLSELLAIDYEKEIEDCRCTREIYPGIFSGGQTCELGQGQKIKLKDFLGVDFFHDLERLKMLGNAESIRVLMFFDC